LIANQVKGTGFRGTLDYLLGKDDAQIIGGNMVGETPKELASEFSVSRALRPKLKHVVYHSSLSLPHDEHLSTSKWKEAADMYVQKMGFSGSQYVVVKHNDTKHDHIHIVASRVRLNGTVVSDSQDYKRSEKVVRGLEKSYGLTPTLSSHEVEKKALTKGELHKVLREQKPSIKMQLQTIIDSATEDRPDANVFAKRLAKQGITVIPNQSKTGHISGISFEINGEKMKGSDLGRSYSWSNLTKRKLNYEERYVKNSKSSIHQSNGKHRSRSRDGDNSSSIGEHTSRLLRNSGTKHSQRSTTDYRRLDQELVHPTRGIRLFDEESSESNQERERSNSRLLEPLIKKRTNTRKRKSKSSRNMECKKHGMGNNANRSMDSGISLSLPEIHLLSALFEIEESKKDFERKKNRPKIKTRNVDQSLSKSKRRGREKGFSIDF